MKWRWTFLIPIKQNNHEKGDLIMFPSNGSILVQQYDEGLFGNEESYSVC